jgi:predicted phage terminase large subunit-like protein
MHGGVEDGTRPGVRIAESNGIYYVEDAIRARLTSGARNALMHQTAHLDGTNCHIRIEQEPGSGGKESAEISVRQLAGYVVRVKPSTTDKVSRARPLASQAEAGNVRIVRGAWNRAFIDELTSFPFGENDDQVDGASSAFNELALGNRDVIAAVTPPDTSWQRGHFK